MQADTIIRTQVARDASVLRDLARRIHAHPELGFKEHQACAWQVDVLQRWGFRVQRPHGGLATAYKATWGRGAPHLAYVAEYDALPELGHACGHNLICTAALGAARGLTAALAATRQAGTVSVIGTPGEELLGGKVKMLRAGAFNGVDAALMAHPGAYTSVDIGSAAVVRFAVTYYGAAAHAAASPERGRNALDAIMLLFHGVNAYRQHVPESCRMHGIVTDGGAAPNIVPERAACLFYLRALDDGILAEMIQRFRAIARGAALMTGTRVRAVIMHEPYKAMRPSTVLNDACVSAAAAVGLRPTEPVGVNRASTDFADVTHVMPGVHMHFAIVGAEVPGHSAAFCKAAASDHGLSQMLKTAETLARVGYRYCCDRAFRRRVNTEFRQRTQAKVGR